LTAPGKGVPNVHGVNQNEYNQMISTFSLPLLVQQMPSLNTEKQLKILWSCKGHLETITYTNDKTWLTTCTKKYRRGRAAALNMVITETGAGTAVIKHYHH
jgi:glyceraldehyde 3-phosphate dehydrogenase